MVGVLLRAVSAGRPRQVRLLLDSGLGTEHQDDCGQTALIRAIFIDHSRHRERIVKMLLKYGADVGRCDVVGRCALSWACLYGREREVALLLNQADGDIDLNQRDEGGQTPLFHAVTSGSASCVKQLVDVLLKYGLSVSKANHSGLTPLMQAIKLRHDVCASILLNQGGEGPPRADIAEKWAKQRMEPRNSLVQRPVFPPILPSNVAQKIRHLELTAVRFNVDSSQESDDDSTYGSDIGSWSEGGEGHPRTSATKVNTSTEVDSSEDEPDACSSPVANREFVATRDVGDLFRMYEDQHCQSYRPSAARPRLAVGTADGLPQVASSTPSQTLPNSGKRLGRIPRRKNSKNPVEFREMVLRRQHRQMSLDAVAPTQFPAPPPDLSSSGEDSELCAAMMGKLWLPKLPEKKLSVNLSSRPNLCVSDKRGTENDWGW